MKRGLFGGSFDPIHLGHLRCAEEICELFSLDEILFIPAERQPLKTERGLLSFHHRAAMVELAIAGNPAFEISRRENRRGGISYSIDTVREFMEEQEPGQEGDLYFIVGQDAFQDIYLWKDWRELLRRCNIIVMTRPGFDSADLEEILPADCSGEFSFDESGDCFQGTGGRAIYFRRLTGLDISSSDIRTRRASGRSIRYLVPDSVEAYIESEGLYGPATD